MNFYHLVKNSDLIFHALKFFMFLRYKKRHFCNFLKDCSFLRNNILRGRFFSNSVVLDNPSYPAWWPRSGLVDAFVSVHTLFGRSKMYGKFLSDVCSRRCSSYICPVGVPLCIQQNKQSPFNAGFRKSKVVIFQWGFVKRLTNSTPTLPSIRDKANKLLIVIFRGQWLGCTELRCFS